ncbi:unnamed protein product [Owenia fusiformis]|uniref:Temptin n=1 Tax=Owenia fusiformis TaxID=6347 RepID=A0A8S4NDS8_OWEFU|nr:unnamed protein product [Owenia fusiformis]
MDQLMILIFLTLCVLRPADGYQFFQGQIPNGDKVPHPCKENHIWKGVGHRNSEGGGNRNPFGEDFKANDKKWDNVLCMKDSDNDGMSNGQELGDPSCVWTPGSQANRTIGLSLPGVCEPWNSPKCMGQNQWDFCNGTKFICPALDATGDDVGSMYREAAPCGMRPADKRCSQAIFLWGQGSQGQCENENMGFRIGKTGFSKIVIQHHWNNPELRDDYYDSSGMMMYYTPNLRPYDGGIMIIGQNRMAIPPRVPLYKVTSKISKACTYSITKGVGPLTMVGSVLHMHYLGKSIKLEQYRGGKMITSLGEDKVYNYDSPVMHNFETPIELRERDEGLLTCNYNSMSRNSTTFWGNSTSAEMCYAFVRYYPFNHNMKFIMMQGEDVCAARTLVDTLDGVATLGVVDGCDLDNFIKNEMAEIKNITEMICDVTGFSCNSECFDAKKKLLKTNVCVREKDAIDMTESFLSSTKFEMEPFWRGFRSCDEKIATEENKDDP